MKICFFGTYESNWPRHITLKAGLESQGVEVLECHIPLWELWRDKTRSFLKPSSLLKLVPRLLWIYLRLIIRHARMGDYDCMLVGFMGYFDLPLARILSRWRGRVLLYTPVVSLYESMAGDRSIVKSRSVSARALKAYESWSIRLVDAVLLETRSYIRYFSEEFNLPESRFIHVPLGSDQTNYYPRKVKKEPGDGFLCFFYGKFTPLQGVPCILKAAKLLESRKDIRFEVVGSGQLTDAIEALKQELRLTNLRHIDWVDYRELPEHIARADVCLGIFGDTDKAMRGIPVKVYDAVAMGKPVITGDTPGARELFTHEKNAILVPPGNPEALAAEIVRLKEDPGFRHSIAEAGYALFREKLDRGVLGRNVVEAIRAFAARPLR
jgi:glycosyltransferase involved in cell wall biosynthesis